VLRQCLLTEQARSQSLTSPTFSNGLVLPRRGHLVTRQRIRIRIFHPIDIHTGKADPCPNPRRYMRTRLAPCGKLVCLSGDRRRTPTHWHAKRCRTAPYEREGCHASAPALQNFLSKSHHSKVSITHEAASYPSAFSYDSNRLLLAGTVIVRASLIWNDLFQANNVDFYGSFSFIFEFFIKRFGAGIFDGASV
jgi:hypothetical protein